MDARDSGAKRSAKGEFGNRRPASPKEAPKKDLCADATKPGTGSNRLAASLHGESAARESGLMAPLVPGGGGRGSGGWLGDALELALGAALAAGWALLTAAGLLELDLQGGAASFWR
jgi:hypothetical protein